jgi:hypothetical protein
MTRGWPAFSKTAALHCLGIEVDIVGLIRVSVDDAKIRRPRSYGGERTYEVSSKLDCKCVRETLNV